MSLVEEAGRYLKGKRVVIVTSVESEGYLQEVVGVLKEASDGCLVVQQEADEGTPTLVNAAHVAWVYEEPEEDEQEGERA